MWFPCVNGWLATLRTQGECRTFTNALSQTCTPAFQVWKMDHTIGPKTVENGDNYFTSRRRRGTCKRVPLAIDAVNEFVECERG